MNTISLQNGYGLKEKNRYIFRFSLEEKKNKLLRLYREMKGKDLNYILKKSM